MSEELEEEMKALSKLDITAVSKITINRVNYSCFIKRNSIFLINKLNKIIRKCKTTLR